MSGRELNLKKMSCWSKKCDKILQNPRWQKNMTKLLDSLSTYFFLKIASNMEKVFENWFENKEIKKWKE